MSQPNFDRNSLNEKEFKQLIKILTDRKKELESRTSLETVQIALQEAGLLNLLTDDDLKTVRDQALKEIKKREFQSSLWLVFTPIVILSPLLLFAGYKANDIFATASQSDVIATNSESLNSENRELENENQALQNQLRDTENQRDKLQEEINGLRKEHEEILKNIENIEAQPESVSAEQEDSEPTFVLPEQQQSEIADAEASTNLFGQFEEITANFQQCQRDGKKVICSVTLKNVKRDTGLVVFHFYERYGDLPKNITAFISDGSEFVPDTISISTKTSTIENQRSDYSLDINLLENVNVKMTLFLNNIPEEVEEFTAFSIPIQLIYPRDDGKLVAEDTKIVLNTGLSISE